LSNRTATKYVKLGSIFPPCFNQPIYWLYLGSQVSRSTDKCIAGNICYLQFTDRAFGFRHAA